MTERWPEVALGDVLREEPAGLGEQHGGLAPEQVVADGLAGALRVAPDAEHVVAQGEGLTDVPAEGLEGGQGVGVGPGGEGAEQERPLHGVGAGLEAGHPARLGEVAPPGRGAGDVEQLALHELAEHVGPGPLQRGLESAREHPRLGEREVAEEDGDAVAEEGRVAERPCGRVLFGGLDVRRHAPAA